MLFPKPEPYAKVKAKTKRQKAQVRALARTEVYTRVDGLCQRCGRRLVLHLADARSAFDIAHAHEIRKRSLGGDPTDPEQIVIVCAECHELLNTNQERVELRDGQVWFVLVPQKERIV